MDCTSGKEKAQLKEFLMDYRSGHTMAQLKETLMDYRSVQMTERLMTHLKAKQ